jgi:hypothetical protein
MKTWLILTLCTLGTAAVFGGTPKEDAKNAVLAAEQASDPAYFAREYEARFTAGLGAVFPEHTGGVGAPGQPPPCSRPSTPGG